ncbi:mitochondrial ribosomal protein subunit Mrp10 [Mycotypha africana]|uniref:mitochondrial ribosomal protein subunit Mrp10 n=1 Tax=Mycotypha africana TaxID=64632 RepID=UPI0022FFF91A|nr:mitochondrial ribosomal protein subunit Mrp10 [Mycotypha africana]KAI8968600.1 mitochondrial ribosomal protein subunit Mrp10 [Mycotypha africana]
MKYRQLKVKPRKIFEVTPCLAEMGAVFECWATTGSVDSKNCAAVAKNLSTCMGKSRLRQRPTNTINYHLARLSKQL